MRLSRWLMLIAVVVGLGCLQVTQRNAMFLNGYAVGERLESLHTQETDVSWLRARVVGLRAPRRLAQIAQERQLKLVAWSALSPQLAEDLSGMAQSRTVVQQEGHGATSLTHLASAGPGTAADDGLTSD